MKKKIKIIILLLISIGFVTTVTAAYSKYISNSFWNYYLKSQHFYFESEDLSLNGTNNSNTLWNGESISFKINNYLNDSLVTESDISYSVNCVIESENKDSAECLVNGEKTYTGTLSSYKECINETNDGKDVSSYSKSDCEINGYTYLTNKAYKELNFEIIPKENEIIEQVKVKVTVTSTSPYKKTLIGYYDLNKSELINGKIEKEYINYNDYSRLIITNYYNEKKCINIKWDSSTKIISEDNNYEIVNNNEEFINEINIKVDAKSNIDYIFYDINNHIDDFEIKEIECSN